MRKNLDISDLNKNVLTGSEIRRIQRSENHALLMDVVIFLYFQNVRSGSSKILCTKSVQHYHTGSRPYFYWVDNGDSLQGDKAAGASGWALTPN
jgi:hypothetical protein